MSVVGFRSTLFPVGEITNLYRCATCGTAYRKDGAAWVLVSAPSRPRH